MTTQENINPPNKGDLTFEEREMLHVAAAGDMQKAIQLLSNSNVRVNCLDEYGMTPLMHAAYKSKADMCRLLLQHGADVNCNEHEYGYTALMFAGLSGNAEITEMILDAGAETDLVNSVGRTAAQMAAFVGQHNCVTVINNFFSRARLEYYTRPQGSEREPKLPPKLAGPLHKIIMTTNLNPVKMVMLVKENPLLVDVVALEKCYRVMDLLCEQCVKQRDMNEVLAMKMHYISCVLQKCLAFLQERDHTLDALLKSLLKGRDGDGFPQYQEKFIRDCIRKFPYCEATLLQQLVQSIAPVEINTKEDILKRVGNRTVMAPIRFYCINTKPMQGNDPTAFSVLTQALTGQMVLMDTEYCATCGEKGADKKCSYCKMVIYCGQACQRLHWFTHKKQCRVFVQQRDIQRNGPTRPLRDLSSCADDREAEKAASSMLALCLGFSDCAISHCAFDDTPDTPADAPCAEQD